MELAYFRQIAFEERSLYFSFNAFSFATEKPLIFHHTKNKAILAEKSRNSHNFAKHNKCQLYCFAFSNKIKKKKEENKINVEK